MMNGTKISSKPAWSTLVEDMDTVTTLQPSLSDLSDKTWTSVQRACSTGPGAAKSRSKWLYREAAEEAALSWRLEKYKILRCIGEGASGKVYACEVECQSGRSATVAMKVVSRAGLTEGSKSLLLSELKVLTTLTTSEFQHGIQLKEAFHDDQNCYFITDLAENGTLKDVLKKTTAFDADRTRFTMAVMLHTIGGLHQRGIIHRDIKPGNILFSNDGYPLIGDFGIARQFAFGIEPVQQLESAKVELLSRFEAGDLTVGRCGTHGYMAPEIVRGRPYSYGVDLFSLGVVFYQLMHGGKLPFTGKTLQELIYASLCVTHEVDSKTREEQPHACDLLDQLLQKTPADRIDIETAKAHPYFNGIDWKLVEAKAYKVPNHWVPLPIHFNRAMPLEISVVIGPEILEPILDRELLGFDIRTLPIEPRDWTLNDYREVPWPTMSKTPAQAQEVAPMEVDHLGGLDSSLLGSIPAPEDEEDEDYLDYEDPCIQLWASGWKHTYETRLGSGSLSGLGGDVEDIANEERMDVDEDEEDSDEEDMVELLFDGSGSTAKMNVQYEDDPPAYEEVVSTECDAETSTLPELEEEDDFSARMDSWLDRWSLFTSARLRNNNVGKKVGSSMSTASDSIGEDCPLGTGHTVGKVSSVVSRRYDFAGSQLRFTLIVHPPAEDQDQDVLDYVSVPVDIDQTLLIPPKRRYRSRSRDRKEKTDRASTTVDSNIATTKRANPDASSPRPAKRVRFEVPDDEDIEETTVATDSGAASNLEAGLLSAEPVSSTVNKPYFYPPGIGAFSFGPPILPRVSKRANGQAQRSDTASRVAGYGH